jgi:hypothetical protein
LYTAGSARERPEAVLEAYALMSHEHHGTELAALLQRAPHVARARQHLSDLIRDLLTKAAETDELREDVAPAELASYSLHAPRSSQRLPSKSAVRRRVTIILAGLHPPPLIGGGAGVSGASVKSPAIGAPGVANGVDTHIG